MKRLYGQYFTSTNPFNNAGFYDWAKECDLINNTILEPFAGSNNLIYMLKDIKLCKDNFKSFDLYPKDKFVLQRDTLKDFPEGFNICITNPPYLGKSSARRRKLSYPDTSYDDLYKFALEKCLNNCDYVAAIIPASFINANIFRKRLSHYILLNSKMFNDTEHPVCLALFKKYSEDADIYNDNNYLGKLSALEKKIPNPTNSFNIKFNDPNGELGLIAIDNTTEPSIRFLEGKEISPNRIGISSRSITRISIQKQYYKTNINNLIYELNNHLNQFRKDTYDLFLTPFKGLRKDNMYRRRLDYSLARKIINEVLYEF